MSRKLGFKFMPIIFHLLDLDLQEFIKEVKNVKSVKHLLVFFELIQKLGFKEIAKILVTFLKGLVF